MPTRILILVLAQCRRQFALHYLLEVIQITQEDAEKGETKLMYVQFRGPGFTND